jgi:GAF domain-containing protein
VSESVANLGRMSDLAGYDLFDAGLADDLTAVCRRTAQRLGIGLAAVQAVLDTATAVLATNGGDGDFLSPTGGYPNELSLCVHVVRSAGPYVVSDLSADPLHAGHPGVRLGLVGSYAGAPVRLPDGEILGTHCVMDPEPRTFTDADLAELDSAAKQISAAIAAHHLPTTS